MPADDWTRVTAGTFHHFHSLWIARLSDSLNGGLLPADYLALVEQHAGDVRMRLSESAAYREARKTLVIRHRSGRSIVAMLEIVSPANKDRAKSVERLVRKAESALRQDIHLSVIDLLPPGPWDPRGMNAAIWEAVGGEEFEIRPDKPLTLAAYLCDRSPEIFVEPLAVGDLLPDMPLFLDVDHYVNVPLESTYMAAYAGVPAILRDAIEGRAPAEV